MNKNKLQNILCVALPIIFIGVLALGISSGKKEKERLANLKLDYEISYNTAAKPEDNTSSKSEGEQQEEAGNDTESDGAKKDFKFEDKTILFLGDGVSVEGVYQKKAAEILKLKDYVNGAKSGLILKEMDDEISEESLKNIDIVVILGGTNDYSRNRTLGEAADDKTVDTFYGNIQDVIDNVKSFKENVELVFLTPLKHGHVDGQPSYPDANNQGSYLDDYVNAIKEVCTKNNVKYIDMFNESGIDESNVAEYTTNNIILSEAGHDLVAEVIAEKLRELFEK